MSIQILDTHQHLLYPNKYPYTWTDGLSSIEQQAFQMEDYLIDIETTGIKRTIFMESSPEDPHWLSETKFIIEMAQQPDSIIEGIIANCRPESENGFEAYLESIQHPKVIGFRRVLHTMPNDLSQSDHFIKNINLLGKRNFTFDLCVLARQLPLAQELVRKCPNVQFILDHCGVPDISKNLILPWQNHIKLISDLPNVICKISGVLAYCTPGNATTEIVRPYVEFCLENFGWNRVVWGGDWPVCNIRSDLKTWVKISRKIVSNADEKDQRRLFHENAERIYLKKN